jgi:hypothetical protein
MDIKSFIIGTVAGVVGDRLLRPTRTVVTTAARTVHRHTLGRFNTSNKSLYIREDKDKDGWADTPKMRK